MITIDCIGCDGLGVIDSYDGCYNCSQCNGIGDIEVTKDLLKTYIQIQLKIVSDANTKLAKLLQLREQYENAMS